MTPTLLTMLLPLAAAQEAPPPAPPPPLEATPAGPEPAALLAEREKLLAEKARMESLTADAALLVDPRVGSTRRAEAAQRLADKAGEQALPFLRSALADGDVALRIAVLDALRRINHPESAEAAGRALRSPRSDEAVVGAALSTLAALQRPEAAQVLAEVVADEELSRELRRRALQTLELSYPDQLAGLDVAAVGSDLPAKAAAVAASSTAGGVLLSSIGVWGQSDSAVVIGALGGTVVGGAVGAQLVRRHPLTNAEGLRIAAGTGWGLAGSEMLSSAVWGAPGEREEGGQNGAAALRSLGVVGGAMGGVWASGRSADPSDPLESTLTGYLGAQMGIGLADLLVTDIHTEVVVAPEGELGWEEQSWSYPVRNPQAGALGALMGSGLGLGVGLVVEPVWSPTAADLALTGLAGVEGAVVAASVPGIFEVSPSFGHVRLGTHAAASMGLAGTGFWPVNPEQAALGWWGAALGHGAGAGLPLLISAGDQRPTLIGLTMGGLAGLGGGLAAAPLVQVDGGDRAMMGVGTALGFLDGLAIGGVIAQNSSTFQGDQVAGLALTTGGLVGAGLTALSPKVQPEAGEMALLGTGAAWGATFGVLAPISFSMEDPAAPVEGTTIGGNLGLGLAGLLISPMVEVDPRRTVLPQIAGLGGATAGALGASLGTAEARAVAGAAMAGGALGLLGGGIWEATRGAPADSDRARSRWERPDIDLPGTWTWGLQPVGPDGGRGLSGQLAVHGW